MDKFGSHSRKRMPVWRMLQDLDMKDHRITSLGLPRDSSDAVTKRWVSQQLKDSMKDIDELDSEIKQMQKEHDASIKDLTKKLMAVEDVDKSDSGKVNSDLDMRKYHLLNLPLPRTDNEPITKALYDRLKEDLDALRLFVELKHA